MKIKSLADLTELKNQALPKFETDGGAGKIKIVVGMATCGIAAGAKPIMQALTNELESKKLENVSVSQVGCIGLCEYEPIVEVFESGKPKVTYVKMTAEKAMEVMDGHIIGGRIVKDYTIGASAATV